MKKPNHFYISLGVVIIIWILFKRVEFNDILIPIWFGWFPDFDHFVKKSKLFKWIAPDHRSALFHSIAIPLIPLLLSSVLFQDQFYAVLICFLVGVHCLCDMRKELRGFGLVKVWKGKALSSKGSNIWLFLQFVGGCVILGGWLILV